MADALQDMRDEVSSVANLAARIRDLCGDDDQAFLDTLEGHSDVTEAVRAVVRWMHEQQAASSSCKSLAATYSARVAMFDDREARARTALLRTLDELGVRSMPLPEATLSIVAGRVKVMGEPDADKLPDNLVRTKREPDKAAIRAALESGALVDGCSLSNTPPTLMVRVR